MTLPRTFLGCLTRRAPLQERNSLPLSRRPWPLPTGRKWAPGYAALDLWDAPIEPAPTNAQGA
jgi:hypothetical protein